MENIWGCIPLEKIVHELIPIYKGHHHTTLQEEINHI